MAGHIICIFLQVTGLSNGLSSIGVGIAPAFQGRADKQHDRPVGVNYAWGPHSVAMLVGPRATLGVGPPSVATLVGPRATLGVGPPSVATLVGPRATLGVGATASGYAGLPQSYAGCRTGKAKQTSHRCTAKLAILHICVLRSNPGLENPTPETTQPAKRLTFKGSRK